MMRAGLALTVFAIPFGFYLGEGLSFSTLIQLLATVLLLPAARYLTHRDQLLLMLLLISLPLSVVPLLILANETPHWFQVGYFALCIVHLFLFIKASQQVDFRIVVRATVRIAALSALAIGLFEFLFLRDGYLQLFFQDKSHTAVALVILSMLSLWAFDSIFGIVLCIGLYFLSMATASRLVLFAAPFMAVAVGVYYVRSRRRADTALKVYGHHLLLVGVPSFAWLLGGTTLTASLAGRLDQSDAAAASSTQAHFELIRLAFEAKLYEPVLLFFGWGPGAYSGALRWAGIDLNALSYWDRSSYLRISSGFAPIHSASASIITEFSLVIAISYVAFIVAIAKRLWVRREWYMLMILGALLSMTAFYSTHNEPVFTATLCLLAGAAYGGQSRGRHTLAGPPQETVTVGPELRVQAISAM